MGLTLIRKMYGYYIDRVTCFYLVLTISWHATEKCEDESETMFPCADCSWERAHQIEEYRQCSGVSRIAALHIVDRICCCPDHTISIDTRC